jgi:hypothetical protein
MSVTEIRTWTSLEPRPGDGDGSGAVAPDHVCFIAGRYRNGALSDSWTDVLRCAERTFVSFVPSCACGWTGGDNPATDDGYRRGWRACIEQHLAEVSRPAGGRGY